MENENIAELIERITTGDPWHGPNVVQLLEGVSAVAAARRPTPDVHSLWELVLHMTGWAEEVRQRMLGRAAQEPAAGDWPAVGEITEERWAEARNGLFEAHRALVDTVRRQDARTLDEPVVDFRDRPLGAGLSRYLTLHGLVHHTVYHSGQLAVVRKMVT